MDYLHGLILLCFHNYIYVPVSELDFSFLKRYTKLIHYSKNSLTS